MDQCREGEPWTKEEQELIAALARLLSVTLKPHEIEQLPLLPPLGKAPPVSPGRALYKRQASQAPSQGPFTT